MSRPLGHSIDEDLQLLEAKLKLLKREYEQYFMGNRPREPLTSRAEVQKIVAYWSNLSIKNTASRFRFNTICARFFTFRRQWDETCRKIENGTYAPHVFKANLREGSRPRASEPAPADTGPDIDTVHRAYVEARAACGQNAEVPREKLAQLLQKQEAALREKFGCQGVRFRVVVEEGRARLKAAPIRG